MKQHRTTFMKNIKHILAIMSFAVLCWLSLKYPGNHILSAIGTLLFATLIFNFLVRKRIHFKSYFLNKYNFSVSTHFSKSQTEISSELMYEKMLEVLRDSNYKIQDSNAVEKSIFVTTPMSFKSWGENIYIDIEESKIGKTVIHITSAALQVYAWGKNEQNFDKLITEIEESLIV